MLAVSLYLNKKMMDQLKKLAALSKRPVSQILQIAVEQYLQENLRNDAKGRVLRALEGKCLGKLEELHSERIMGEDCRG